MTLRPAAALTILLGAVVCLFDVRPVSSQQTEKAHGTKDATIPACGSVEFSPDGQKLAVGGYRIVRLLDVKSGKILRQLSGVAGNVTSVSFAGNDIR